MGTTYTMSTTGQLTREQLAAFVGRPYSDIPEGAWCDQWWPELDWVDGVLTVVDTSEGGEGTVIVDIVNGRPVHRDGACDALMCVFGLAHESADLDGPGLGRLAEALGVALVD